MKKLKVLNFKNNIKINQEFQNNLNIKFLGFIMKIYNIIIQ